MASLLFLFPFLFLSTPLVYAAREPAPSPTSQSASTPAVAPSFPPAPPAIQKACSITKYPGVCASSLSNSTAKSSLDIVKSAVSLSLADTIAAQNTVDRILKGAGNNLNLTVHCKNCLEELNNAVFRLQSSLDALPAKTKDARAWISAVLVFHSDCHSNFKKVNDTVEINNLVSFLDTLIMMTSNALAMVRAFDLFGPETDKWVAPKTERDGYFEPAKGGAFDFPTRFPVSLKIDATVSKDGKGYKTVQEAVNAAPSNLTDKKYLIHIKEGIYEENVRVPLEKKNVVFLGDGIGRTVITGKLAVGPPGVFTYSTATAAVLGDGFMAKDLTFKNTAGVPTTQAVAFRSDGDKSYFENCEFVGHQDTLYCHGLRQYYKSCIIEGNVDFIFGNSAAYFKDCKILVNPRQETPEKGEKNAVTAHGRTDPGQSTGFVFDNCTVTGTPEYMKLFDSNPKVHKNFLGRPWKEYSKTVFLHSYLDNIIDPAGWLEFDGNQSLSTAYYGEFENKGPGSDLAGRVNWSSKVPPEHAATFSVQSLIQGVEWLPKA